MSPAKIGISTGFVKFKIQFDQKYFSNSDNALKHAFVLKMKRTKIN